MKKEKSPVLIVDDNEMNRKLLAHILLSEYSVVEAENGQAAFEVLKQQPEITAILLDLVMPVMDGHTFLKLLPDTAFSNLPVLVLTGSTDADSEQRVLNEGAWDFVPKPYTPQVLLSRLKNAIARSQIYLLEQMRYVNEHDSLTGLFNRSEYFSQTRRMLDEHPETVFAMVCLNTKRFRALNSFWGEQEGNRFLCFAADALRDSAAGFPVCTFGRIEADIFSICLPYDETELKRYTDQLRQTLSVYKSDYLVEASFGVYVIDEPTMDVSAMYSLATLAVEACKTEHTPLCYYRAEMGEKVLQEQQIISEMQHALDTDQFVIYLQPKYNIKTNAPYGAEALIRWQHPTRGLLAPGAFIPVFERNGFIGKVDYYMWEHTCRLLRKWIDEGLNPAPVSVNVSRVNLYNPNLVQSIVDLVKKYGLPPKLLNLEITESAYMDDPDTMQKTIHALQQNGFVIMMDDFGSGYSSLNTLKDIYVDILKVDMKFLAYEESDGRGERILASVIRMAGWLELPVIVEGVETLRQKEFLDSIGCGYVQGYFFARPMPVADYEALIRCADQQPVLELWENHEQMVKTLWSVNPQIELLFKSISQPVVIFEFDGTNFRALRVNRQYTEKFGYASSGTDPDGAYLHHVSPETLEQIRAAFRNAACSKGAVSFDYPRFTSTGAQEWMHLDVQYWGTSGNTAVLFVMFQNITDQKLFERLSASLRQPGAKPLRKKLLVLEDTFVARDLIRRTFADEYEVLEAENGREGLDLLIQSSGEIAAILLDLLMPVMDGRDFLREKNENIAWRDIPVVIISADTDGKDQINMLEMGVNDYVTKPFVPEVLRRRVENVLEYNDRFRILLQEYHQDIAK